MDTETAKYVERSSRARRIYPKVLNSINAQLYSNKVPSVDLKDLAIYVRRLKSPPPNPYNHEYKCISCDIRTTELGEFNGYYWTESHVSKFTRNMLKIIIYSVSVLEKIIITGHKTSAPTSLQEVAKASRCL